MKKNDVNVGRLCVMKTTCVLLNCADCARESSNKWCVEIISRQVTLVAQPAWVDIFGSQVEVVDVWVA